MNTRKDYWRAVEIIKGFPIELRYQLATAFIAFFVQDNPRFDTRRCDAAVNETRTEDDL